MEQTIKAIETEYKGYRFRSRLEARWAVFFDVMKIRWEYEYEGFDLGDNIFYLPDFWFPDQKCFVEIKPDYPDEKEIEKYKKLSLISHHWVDLIEGSPGKHDLWAFREGKETDDIICFGQCILCKQTTFASYIPKSHFEFDETGVIWKPQPFGWVIGHCYNCNGNSDFLPEGIQELAIHKAKSARFEFGESGL